MRTSDAEMVVRGAMVAVGWIFCLVARGDGDGEGGREARWRERVRRRGIVSTRRMRGCCCGGDEEEGDDDEAGWR